MKRAVCALIFTNSNKILAVSRKYDPTDFGLVGGKVDPGETPEEALVRETKEETGLDLTEYKQVFEIEDSGFICTTYLCKASGQVSSSEKGIVKEVDWKELLNGTFGSYNSQLFNHLCKKIFKICQDPEDGETIPLLEETIAKAKEKLLNTIIEDNTISKIEKLQLISDNDLFGTRGSIQQIFDEYEEEFKKELGGRAMLFDWFHFQEFARHSMVNLSEIFDYSALSDDMITILRDRYTGKTFEISKYEFIDTVYDWCIKNKCIGFQWDW